MNTVIQFGCRCCNPSHHTHRHSNDARKWNESIGRSHFHSRAKLEWALSLIYATVPRRLTTRGHLKLNHSTVLIFFPINFDDGKCLHWFLFLSSYVHISFCFVLFYFESLFFFLNPFQFFYDHLEVIRILCLALCCEPFESN